MPRPAYAHTRDGQPPETWQPLRDHLEAVAGLASGFSAAFDAGEWGRLLGLWHDLGKYRAQFQEYLNGGPSGGDHAAAGALLAHKLAGKSDRWLPLAFPIAGHHTGLANLANDTHLPSPLRTRLKATAPTLAEALEHAPPDLVEIPLPELPSRFRPGGRLGAEQRKRELRRLEIWIRFLFSALVDADFLDTERFYHGEERLRLVSGFASLSELRDRLDRHVDGLAAGAQPTEVNRLRAEVLAAARRAAELPPGLFSLSVPTGGGKTLASMSFALRHAEGQRESHGLRRVIVVIPLTSILEQTAEEYRKAFGPAAGSVIEHHSNLDPEKETRLNKLASENWDAPVIVTTAVQLFESLFAHRSSRCRKLHNVARSVIVLDEAQTLPPGFLAPILEMLDELVRHYGCSVVLSTATQPALARRDALPEGLVGVREMMPEPAALSRRLKRFEPEWPDPDAPAKSWEALAGEIAGFDRVLAVVHKRQDARDLARLLPEDGLFHLSALMCAAHRAKVLAEIKATLRTKGPCRLVSTQLVEAGVDVDFPVVFRALAGIDSLLQAGGRCNREGGQKCGRLMVFRAPTAPPPGTPLQGMEATEALFELHGNDLDLFDPATVTEYFKLLYAATELDARKIRSHQSELDFATVAARFRLIQDDYTRPLVVPWGEGTARMERFRREGPRRDTLRALQPFVVNVPERHLRELELQGAAEPVHGTVYCLSPDVRGLYQQRYGFVFEPGEAPERSPLIA